MTTKTSAALLLAAWLATPLAFAQPYGMGPGMMGSGYGGGYGPGMVAGGPAGWGMGPGMAGGWGSGGGMGAGMMGGGYGEWVLDRADIGLSSDQRSKIVEIQKEISGKQWEAMRKVHDQHWQWRRGGPGAFDEQAARAAYAAMSEAHRQVFESSLDAHKRIDAVLTPQQREQLAASRARR
jgi:Spy/CpxP family protein refolding chaperone